MCSKTYPLSAITAVAVRTAPWYCPERRLTVDKKLEMRCKIGAVLEHYAEQSEYYLRANGADRLIVEGQVLLAHNGAGQQDYWAV